MVRIVFLLFILSNFALAENYYENYRLSKKNKDSTKYYPKEFSINSSKDSSTDSSTDSSVELTISSSENNSLGLLESSNSFQIQGENSKLSNAASNLDLVITQSASRYYTYKSKSGSVYPREMLYQPGQFRLFGWEYNFLSPSAVDIENSYGFVGNEVGDPLYQELKSDYTNPGNRTPVISGVIKSPQKWPIQANVGFRQLDHFSVKNVGQRSTQVNTAKSEYDEFSWFGANFPPYSLLQAGVSYEGKHLFDTKLSFDVNDGFIWLYGFNEQYYPLEMRSYKLSSSFGNLSWDFYLSNFDYYNSVENLTEPSNPSIYAGRLNTQKNSFFYNQEIIFFDLMMGLETFNAQSNGDYPFAWQENLDSGNHFDYLLWLGFSNTRLIRGYCPIQVYYDFKIAYGDEQYLGYDTLGVIIQKNNWKHRAQINLSYGNTLDPFAPIQEFYKNDDWYSTLSNSNWLEAEVFLGTSKLLSSKFKNTSNNDIQIEAWILPWYSINPQYRLFTHLKDSTYNNKKIHVLNSSKKIDILGIKEGLSYSQKFSSLTWGLDAVWQQVLLEKNNLISITKPKYSYGMWTKLNLASGLSVKTHLKRISSYKYNWIDYRVSSNWDLNIEMRQMFLDNRMELFVSFLNILSHDTVEYPIDGNQNRFRVITGMEWIW